MSTIVGVLGAPDLTPGIASVVREQPGTLVVELPYDDDAEVPELIRTHAAEVDGWLFASVVPYSRAVAAGVLADGGPDGGTAAPAAYIEYTGPTLAQALLEMTRRGHDVARMSVDTLPADDVWHTLAEAGVPAEQVRILPHGSHSSPARIIDFHRRARTEPPGSDLAVTCVSAVRDAISPAIPTFRLAPLTMSVRIALRQLLLAISNQLAEDARVAIGMIQMSGDDTGLAAEAAALGGSLARAAGGSHLLITTRGPLVAATAGFTSLPMLGRLADHHQQVRIGLGLGDTAADAGARARHALARARVLGDVRAVLSLRDGTDMVLDAPAGARTTDTSSLAVLARRVGVSIPTLRALQELREGRDDGPVTTRDIADHLGIQLRAARRTVQRLEMGGLAERAGQHSPGGAGRPLTLYKLSV